MPKKKPFIDKKKAVTFHLVHRSQKDPLLADDDAPSRVLLPLEENKEKRLKEQQEFGIFYDDEYDYMKHLKSRTEFDECEVLDVIQIPAAYNKKVEDLKLPEAVFPSKVEHTIGMLNLAAPVSGPVEGVDPDVIAALDEDFDFDDPDNVLDDDFVMQANDESESLFDNVMDAAGGSNLIKYLQQQNEFLQTGYSSDEGEEHLATQREEAGYCSSGGEVEAGDDLDFSPHHDNNDDDKFTSYSLTSSVVPRSENLKLLDDRFEKFFDQYLDDELGALDEQEMGGSIKPNSEYVLRLAAEYTAKKEASKVLGLPKTEDVSKKEVELSGDEQEEKELVEVDEKPHDQYDCESIISTYSNIYNHPRLIVEPRQPKSRTTSRVEPDPSSSEDEEDEMKGVTFDRKNETTEERKQRQKAVKELQRRRRERKKEIKTMFHHEQIKQRKQQTLEKNFMKMGFD